MLEMDGDRRPKQNQEIFTFFTGKTCLSINYYENAYVNRIDS